MQRPKDELTVKQQALITALITPLAVPDAAKVVGISERTAWYWLKLPHFQEAYKAARKVAFDAIFEKTRAELVNSVPLALETLKRHIRADIEPTSASQMKALELLFARLESQIQIPELSEKIERLEALLKETKANDKP